MKLLDEASGFGIGEQLGACLTLANFTLKVASFVRGTFLCMNAMQATDERKFEICFYMFRDNFMIALNNFNFMKISTNRNKISNNLISVA